MFRAIIYDGLVGDAFLRGFCITFGFDRSRMVSASPRHQADRPLRAGGVRRPRFFWRASGKRTLCREGVEPPGRRMDRRNGSSGGGVLHPRESERSMGANYLGGRAFHPLPYRGGAVTEKAKRLEVANFERAEAAVRWEDADNKAGETGRPSDKDLAAADDRALDAADRKIKKIEAER